MLYNPKWQKTDDNCAVSLLGFLTWVEAQNPKRRYDYPHKAKCAVGCWLKATGHDELLRSHWGPPSPLYRLDYLAAMSPQNYGALAKRLRVLAERPF